MDYDSKKPTEHDIDLLVKSVKLLIIRLKAMCGKNLPEYFLSVIKGKL